MQTQELLMTKRKEQSPERKELIKNLITEFDLKTAADVQNMLKEIFAPVLQGMLEGEMDDHLGYDKYEHSDEDTRANSRNGHSQKTVTTSYGDVEIDIPRDRNGEYEPQAVKKYQRDVSDIESKVISMYAKGMTTRDISDHLNDIYGIEASAEMISKITDRILPEAKAWQTRPLDPMYIVMFMDAIHYHVKEDNTIVKKAVYISIGIRTDGTKDVLGMYIGGNESAKYWLGVLNDLKSRGMQDVLITCVDGLTGFVDAIATVFPDTDVQRCIIHQIRSSTKYVTTKDIKPFMADLKKIYKAPNQQEAFDSLTEFEAKWGKRYPACIKSWKDNWDELTSFFDYPVELRKVIYTTNAIEGFNRQLRKVTKNRTVFPTDDALFKLLFLAMKDITAKWVGKPFNWALIMSQLLIMYPDRLKYEQLV